MMEEKMKPSGIAWIGDIPQSWNLLKLKYFSYLKGRIGWQGLTADEFIDEGPYLITGTDFENGRIQFDRSYHISEKRYEEAPEIQLSVGDLLVTKDGTVGKMAYVDELPGKSSLNSHLLLIRPLNNKFDNRFLFWLMGSSVFTGYTDYAQDGTVMASLSQEKIGNFLAYFPPLREQQAIADYLDVQCAKIDSIAADLEKQIELLQKYKKSLITETVTKGLDKSVPMKDSGKTILGSVNKQYQIKKLKYIVATPITDGPHETPELVDEGIPFLSAESVKNGILDFNYARGFISEKEHKLFCQKIKPQLDDVFIVKSGATTGNSGIVKTDKEFSIWSPLALIRCDNQTVLQKFIYYSTLSNYFVQEVEQGWSYGTQQNIGMGVIENLYVIIPPIRDQHKIVDFLDDQCTKIDGLIQEKKEELAILKQHKKSLIYEYVTGKKRVKEAEQWQSKAVN